MRHPILAILIITVASVMFTLAHGAADPDKEAKQQDIRQLIIASGSATATTEIVDSVLTSYRQQYPNMPDSFWKDANNNINVFDYLEKLVPIYDRYLSHEDIKSLLKFHESPTGKKLVKVQPMISHESMQASKLWGQEAIRKLELQFKAQAKK